MRSRTQIAALAVVMIIAIGTAVLPAMADTGGTSTASFNLSNVAPSVISITMNTGNGVAMTPQAESWIQMDISDANTLDDINEVQVIIKTNTTDTSDPDSVTDKATFRWTPAGGDKGTWSLVGPTGSTWSIDNTASMGPPKDNRGATVGTWHLLFLPGKVARESNTWDIYVEVTDKGGLTGDNISWGHIMVWYGEISAVDTSYSFGDIGLGETNKNISTPSDHNIDVKTISNGNYKLSSKSGNWTNESNVAVLDWDGTLDAGHFALEVDGNGTVDTFNYVNDSYEAITDYNNVNAPTAETGDTKEIYQWISVADSGLLPGTYSGTYYVQIADAA